MLAPLSSHMMQPGSYELPIPDGTLPPLPPLEEEEAATPAAPPGEAPTDIHVP